MSVMRRAITRRMFVGGSAAAGATLLSPAGYAQALRGGLFDHADPALVPGSPDDQSAAFAEALQRAAAAGRPLFLPPGRYEIANVALPATTHLIGAPGETRLVFRGGSSMLSARHAHMLRLEGVTIDGAALPLQARALLDAEDVTDVTIDDCDIVDAVASGFAIRDAAGRVNRCDVTNVGRVGIDIDQSRGMEVTDNHVSGSGDTGILIERDAESDDNSIVSGNRVSGIRADSGGNGQNGNGINLDKANGVIVTGNRVDDCAFSAIRCFSSDGVSVTDNIATRSGEMAIFVEFAFEGAVVANNLVDTAWGGISFANFLDYGGRMGTCSGNIVRRITGGPHPPDGQVSPSPGIAAEADVAITGNVVEDAPWGLQLGWGPYLRDVTATGNIIRRTGIGIAVSVVEGAGPALISGNLIDDAKDGAILGMRWHDVATGELADGKGDIPIAGITVSGNQRK